MELDVTTVRQVKEDLRGWRLTRCVLVAERQLAHRQRVLEELDAELAALGELEGWAHTRRVCALRASRRYGKYLRQAKGGGLAISRKAVQEEARLDGKFVVHTNDDTL